MPENPFADESTTDILIMMGDGNVIGITEMIEALKSREVKEGDADDTPQSRGGIRPYHAPLV